MLKNQSDNNKIGAMGENIACKHLERSGFLIKNRNYWKKWGEIDIVAEKNNILHFIEVKSVSKETHTNVTREIGDYNPEENVHPWKLKRLSRVIQSYLLEKTDKDKGQEWQFDIIAVFLFIKDKKAYVRYTENVVI